MGVLNQVNDKNLILQKLSLVFKLLYKLLKRWGYLGTSGRPGRPALPSLAQLSLPNHLLVEQRYYHGDGSKITLLPWPWQYHGGGSKKSSIAQKAQNCQIHSEMEEKIFTATAVVLPRPWKQCNFTSITVVQPGLYQQMIWWFVILVVDKLVTFKLQIMLKYY